MMNSARFDSAGAQLAVAYGNGACRVFSSAAGGWKLNKEFAYVGGPNRSQRINQEARDAKFASSSASHDSIVVAQCNGRSPIHNVGTGKRADLHNGGGPAGTADESKRVLDVEVSQDGKLVAVAYLGYPPHLADAQGAKVPIKSGLAVRRVRIGGANALLCGTGATGSTVEHWDLSNPKAPRLVQSLTSGVTGVPVRLVAISPDGRFGIAAYEYTPQLKSKAFVWNLGDPQPVAVPLIDNEAGAAHAEVVTSVTFHPTRTTPYAVITTSYDGSAKLWNIV